MSYIIAVVVQFKVKCLLTGWSSEQTSLVKHITQFVN